MTFAAWKLVHLFGVIMMFVGLSGNCLHAMNGGTRETHRSRGLAGGFHGAGLLISLAGGLMMLTSLGLTEEGMTLGWVVGKLGLWMVLAVSVVIPNRAPQLAKPLFFLLPVLGVLGAWLALYKPF